MRTLATRTQQLSELVANGNAATSAIASQSQNLEPSLSLLAPAHCTGWKAQYTLARRFPDAFVMSTVGTTIEIA